MKRWTADEIRALGVKTDLATACSIRYGVGRSQAWVKYHAGEIDFPTYRSGRRVYAPVQPLLDLLGLAATPAPVGEAGSGPTLRLVPTEAA